MGHEYFVFKTSFAQERLWFLDQFAPGNPFYNIHIALPLEPGIDADIVERSLREIVRRHEALRTTFVVLKGEPVQAVAPRLNVEVPVIDLCGRTPPEAEAAIHDLSARESRWRFDLATGPLFRVVFVRLDGASVLLLTMHHIVSDGWSMDVFTRELRTLCGAYAAGFPSPLPELHIQYADFANWQREWMQGEVLDKQLGYWTKKLAGAPALLALPADRPRPPLQSYAGAYQSSSMPAATLDLLKRLANREGATMFMALAAVYMALLHRYTDQDDVVIGTPIANRTRPEIHDLIGFFVNTLVLRVTFADNPSFRELLRRLRETAIEAYQHQDLPFEKLVAELAPERHTSHSPIFQAMFVHQTSIEDRPVAAGPRPPADAASPPGVVEYGTSKFDLTLFTAETEHGLAAIVEYNTDLFDHPRMTRLLGHLGRLAAAAVAEPDRPIGELTLLTNGEQAMLAAWSGTTTEYPREASIHSLVGARAFEHPLAPAVVCGTETLCYEELVARAGALAHRLRELGAARDVPVAVCLERSVDLIVALLGVLAAGSAYVPLDPDYPTSRLAFMLEDTAAPVVVTRTALRDRLPPRGRARVLALDDEDERVRIAASRAVMPQSETTGDDLAYIMYTSGSTGRPKGVAVPHRAVVRLVCGTDYVRLGPDETLLQFAPASFDASTFEIWAALVNGARLVVAPPGPLSLDDLGAVIARTGVTTMWLTASLFHEVVDGGLEPYRGVRQLLAGGDLLSPAHAARAMQALPGVRLINGYGPTENTTFTCCHQIRVEDVTGAGLPIGRPIANTIVRVVDRRLQPVPSGVPGELLAGGDGLARGYWRADELTAQRFIADPVGESGARLYRTGDIVRWREDGVLEFLGRRDHQVKIRGFRVELGEVEAALQRHPNVTAAVAAVRDEGGGRSLVAYVAASAADLDAGTLRRFLRTELPDYMVPSLFFISDRLPMTPSGKVDRAAVSISAPEPPLVEPARALPGSDIERSIVEVWQQVLNVDRVGVEDNFFELGGHSLLMVRVQRRLQETLGGRLSLVDLFQFPTVRALAEHLSARDAVASDATDAEARASRQREGVRQQRAVRGAARRQDRA